MVSTFAWGDLKALPVHPSQLCLTEGAKDECNVVEVVARNHDHQEIAVPVANLKLSCQPMVSSLVILWGGEW